MLFGKEVVYNFRGNRKSTSLMQSISTKNLYYIAEALSKLVPPSI